MSDLWAETQAAALRSRSANALDPTATFGPACPGRRTSPNREDTP